ncbi:MAG: S24 family peptidase [Euryarchaeota archaeon]|nr:S24 family peptidase [Euryarchaeota archaeon]
MFMMNTASVLFRTREQLEADEWTLEGNKFRKGVERYLPLYEAKLIHHFDHRLNTFDGVPPEKRFSVKAPGIPFRGRHADAFAVPIPRYWVPEAEVEERLSGKWDRGWLLGWRDVTNVTTNRRTVIATVLPRVGVGHTCPVFLFGTIAPRKAALLLANLCALALDFPARQKIGGNHLTYGYLNQLPVLPPSTYSDRVPWSLGQALCDWLLPRVLELTYTSWDLEPFARDCGYDGPPFRWDEDRRFLLRCELDAAFFHLYGIPRDDVDYIMETFPIVKQKDEAAHGEYRTKRVILEIYDAMQKAIEAGVAYRTLLDPPAADPRVAHPARESVRALLFRRVEPREEDKYQTCVPIFSLKAAAGAFSEGQSVEPEGWAEISTTRTLRPGMFVAQVVGRSMEPLIPDGSWCLFQSPVTGSRQGRILLVQHHDIHDPETGGSYTVKRYRSEKTATPDGSWRHASIWLEPVNPHYDPIAINDRDDAVRVAAEFLELLNAG